MKSTLFLLIITVAFNPLHSRDVLELRIDVDYDQTLLTAALADIAHKASFEWSYNARIIPTNSKITYSADQATIREILWDILGPSYEFKQNGEYLILKKTKKNQEKLIGYISDKNTGKKIANATIYDPRSMQSTITDASGYYELPVKPHSKIIVTKLNYIDTTFEVNSGSPRFINVHMYQDSTVLDTTASTTVLKKAVNSMAVYFERLFHSAEQKVNELNIRDSLHRTFSITFIPPVGSNLQLSSNVVNDYAINVLVGHSRGNRILEVGGLANINKEHVTGVQAAGLINVVGGNFTGVQLAGLFNMVDDTITGIQSAGLSNFVRHTEGAQFAGLTNATKTATNNWQFAGLANLTRRGTTLVQSGGLFNHADTVRLFQSAGISNTVKFTSGAQFSGITNITVKAKNNWQFGGLTNYTHRGTTNVQAAGLINKGDTIQYAQLSGIFNKAKVVRGIQVGLINVASEVEGVQIGLLNFSRKGRYLSLEASTNEVHPFNLNFKSGTSKLYTIFTFGSVLDNNFDANLWSYGLGLGHRFRFNRYLGMCLEGTYHHLNEGGFDFDLQEWVKLTPSLDIPLGRHLSIGIGPSINLLVDGNSALRDRIIPNGVPDFDFSTNAYGWLGGSVALRVMF